MSVWYENTSVDPIFVFSFSFNFGKCRCVVFNMALINRPYSNYSDALMITEKQANGCYSEQLYPYKSSLII